MNSQYHAVSIKPCSIHCEFANSMRGKRFLSTEAPPLPMGGKKKCRCKYQHHADRREDLRRYCDLGLPSKGHFDKERRSWVGGRRRTDRHKQGSPTNTLETASLAS